MKKMNPLSYLITVGLIGSGFIFWGITAVLQKVLYLKRGLYHFEGSSAVFLGWLFIFFGIVLIVYGVIKKK